MSDVYFVMSVNEDGEISASALSSETLRELLQEKYWGDAVFLPHIPLGETQFDIASKSDLRIIKGSQLTPTPKTTVADWDV